MLRTPSSPVPGIASRAKAAATVVVLLWMGLGMLGCTAQPAADALATVGQGTTQTDVLPDMVSDAPASTPDGASAMRAKLVASINVERAARGAAPVFANKTLNDIAEYHVSRMIDGNFFSHVDPYDNSNVAARADKFEYSYLKIGEDLGAGQETPERVLADWLASPSHRAILIDPGFREIGVGVLDGGRLGRYWAVELGTRAGQ